MSGKAIDDLPQKLYAGFDTESNCRRMSLTPKDSLSEVSSKKLSNFNVSVEPE